MLEFKKLVLVVYRCVTNYPSSGTQSNTHLLSYNFLGSGVWVWLAGNSAQGLTRLKSRCQPGCKFHLRLRVLSQAHQLLAKSILCCCTIEVSMSLLAVRHCHQLLEAARTPLLHGHHRRSQCGCML